MSVLTKEEFYDADVLEQLLKHDGVKATVKDALRNYKKRRNNGNRVAIPYDYGKGLRELQKGRLYPQPFLGLATFDSDIRAALAAKYYDEIDMQNSQPVLLEQIAEKEGVQHPALSEFVANRKEILEQLQKNGMNRDEAKQLCFRVFYGGFADEHPLFPAMRKELIALSQTILKKYPEFEKVSIKGKQAKLKDPALHANLEGSVLAHYAQDLETRILLLIDQFLFSKGYSMDVLQHDGGDVRKKNGESIPMTLLEEAQGVVLEKTGFRITLTIKPLEHSFDFSQGRESVIIPSNITITDSWAAEKFVKAVGDRLRRVGTELYVLNNDGIWDSGEFALRMLIEEFEDKLCWKQYNPFGVLYTIPYGSDVTKIGKLMVQTKVKAKEGELPIQYAYKLAEPHEQPLDVIARFNDLLRLVSGNNITLQTYLLKWIAHIIQKPLELPTVGIVLTGNKGVGKDTIFDFLMEFVLGEFSATNYDSNRQFFEKHDTGRKGKLLVKLEEANRKLCMENKDTLKSMVTSTKSTFNAKNEKPVIVPNVCRFVFTSNKGNPLDFADGERRYVILPCSSEKKGDNDYWTSTRALLFNAEAGRTIGDYLLSIDLNGFEIRILPENEYQNEVVETEESSETRFFNHWDGEEVSSSELFDKYRRYCQENDLPSAPNAISFGQRLLPFIRDNQMKKVKKSSGNYYLKNL